MNLIRLNDLISPRSTQPPRVFAPKVSKEVAKRDKLKRRAIDRWENEGGEIDTTSLPQPIAIPAVRRHGSKLFVFDLDGILTNSKAALDPEMADLLKQLLNQAQVAVISGADWPQFERQLLANLAPNTNLKRLSLLPIYGTKFYQFGSRWQQIYADDFTPAEKEKVTRLLVQTVRAVNFGIEKTWGDQIEDLGSQITFSALGQEAPLDLKEQWDADFSKRKKILAVLEDLIPEFTVRLGGTTSIDVTKLGIDKAYGIRKLRDVLGIELEEILFVGSALFPGGNDYPVKEAGVVSIQVNNSEESKQIVESLLTRDVQLQEMAR